MPEKSKAGVSFDDIHSYRNFGLRLKKIEIGFPEVKSSYVDVPGMHGSIDLTEAEQGGVKYGMRKIKVVFDARNCTYRDWEELISRMARMIQGREKKIILDTDPGYYYTGRCHIDTKKSDEVLAEITVTCTCQPFKIDIIPSNEPWIWDVFNFDDDVIRDTSNITINSDDDWQKVVLYGWFYNETPLKIISDTVMQVRFDNYKFKISAGENLIYDIELSEGENEFYLQGNGTVTFIYTGGSL